MSRRFPLSGWRPAAAALCLLGGLAAAPAALAQAPGGRAAFGPPPVAPKVGVTQRLDAQLPLDLALADAHGRPVRLGDWFTPGRPVLLVLGYYRCPNLCGLLMHGVLEALQRSGLPASRYRLVSVSIDPGDTPASAQARQQAYARYAAYLGQRDDAGEPPPAPRLLLADAQAARALARQVGFAYVPQAQADTAADGSRVAHGAALVVVTPRGRVSRYLMGVRFDPHELRLALVEASSGRIGSLADRIALLCAHFDPRRGRYSGLVMNLLRAGGVLLVLALAGWAWRHRDNPGSRA